MSEGGLDRADGQGFVPSRGEDAGQGAALGGVPGLGAGAVADHVVHVGRVHSGAGIGVGQKRGVGVAVGRVQARGAAVGVGDRAAQYRVDAVVVALGLFGAAQHQRHDPLGAHVALAVLVEGAAHPVGGEYPGVVEGGGGAGVEQDVGADDDGGVDLCRLHRLAGQVQRGARRRAGGVDRQGGAAQVQGVGDAVGQDRRRCPRHGVHVDPAPRGEVQGGLVEGGGPDPHAHPRRSGQCGRGQARVRQGLDDDLHDHALLGVHLCGLSGGNAEVGVVEGVDVVDHAGDPRLVGPLVGVEQGGHPLPPLRWDGSGQECAFGQGVPQCGGVVDSSGQTAADSGDRGQGFEGTAGTFFGHSRTSSRDRWRKRG